MHHIKSMLLLGLLLLTLSVSGIYAKGLYDKDIIPADALPSQYIPLLQGKSVALIINQTSKVGDSSLRER